VNDINDKQADSKQIATGRNPVFRVAVTVVALALIAFILSCHLTIAEIDQSAAGTSLAQTLLGDARTALSLKLYTRADLFFHRGVPHIHEKAFDSDIFQKAWEKVSPTKHAHVHGAGGIKEIMPWLELSIKADPQNLDSYLVAAFWLYSGAKRPDLALNVLREAQFNIPFSYRVRMEKGRILLQTGDYKGALQAYDAALNIWQKTADPKDQDALLDKSEALLYHGLLLEVAGDRKGALRDFQARAKIRKPTPEMLERMQQLSQGLETTPPVIDLLVVLLKKEDKHRQECEHQHHDDGDDHHHDEHDDDHEHEHENHLNRP